jgi:putative transposase
MIPREFADPEISAPTWAWSPDDISPGDVDYVGSIFPAEANKAERRVVKRQMAQEFLAGETLHGHSKRHDVSRNLIRVWVQKYDAGDFADDAYREALLRCGLVGSMGRKGNPYDNAKAERFMKTLKIGAVYPMAYKTFGDVARDLPRIIDEVYDRCRLHSALGYISTQQFEDGNPRPTAKSAA